MRVDDRLLELIDRCVTEHGAQVIQVGLRGERGGPLLQVFIDGIDPVTIDQCSQVSRALAGALGHEQLLPAQYRLEVSTPGLDRPLAYPWQYRKHKGRMLRLVVRDAEGSRTLEGILAETGEEAIELSLTDGTRARFPFSTITKATIRTPW
jgi:ribosome maturation factor RimP